MKKDLTELKNRLSWARLRFKPRLTQGAIAEAVGIKQATYSELETGKSSSTAYLPQLAKVLNVDAHWLATGEGSPCGDSNADDTSGITAQSSWIAVTQDEKAALMAARTHPEKTKAFVQFLGMDETERQNLRAYLEIAAGRVPPEKN